MRNFSTKKNLQGKDYNECNQALEAVTFQVPFTMLQL